MHAVAANHRLLDQVKHVAAQCQLTVVRIHTHIGSGTDPNVWNHVAKLSLGMCTRFPTVTTINLGGGFKVGRMPSERSTDVNAVGAVVREALLRFAKETGRELKLEVEPGTFMMANCGVLLTTVQDVVSTGAAGRHFLKVDSGMTEILRPSLYGAQHPLQLVRNSTAGSGGGGGGMQRYVVVGHCCESGDILTPAPLDPELVSERLLPITKIGDYLMVGGCGAYCSSMATKHYNSFPEAAEVLEAADGTLHLIRKRQHVEQIWANELTPLPFTPGTLPSRL
jgi:diaminopimelate decarboxylase